MKKTLRIAIIGCLSMFCTTIPALSQETYKFELMWPEEMPTWDFSSPTVVAVDSSGYVYIVDMRNPHLIQKFDQEGNLITKWGSEGSGDGQFHDIMGVAINSSGDVYVADSGNHRVQKFDSNGTFITKWGSEGTEDGQFLHSLRGVAVDSSGDVYVTDYDNHRIQKFDSNGNFITKWGSPGSGDGQFQWPGAVAVDSSGNVYVAEGFNIRIQKFDSSGTFITKWGSSGEGDGQFRALSGVAVDCSNNVYVVDSGNNRIQKFDSSGTFIIKWGSSGEGDGQFRELSGVAVDYSNNVYVVDSGNDRIQKFDSKGVFITKWGSWGSGEHQFKAPNGLAIDSSGNIYVTDYENHYIQKFDSDGNFIIRWGSQGSGDGQFWNPEGIAVDSSDNVYVADWGNSRIQKFDSNGIFIAKWGSCTTGDGTGDGELRSIRGVAVDPSGYVYTIQNEQIPPILPPPGVINFARIQKFDLSGNFITKWGSYGTNDGQFLSLFAIAADSRNVYAAELAGGRFIQKFDPNGNFITKLGTYGNAVALDSSGNVYVAGGGGNSRIQKFDSDGNFITEWGTYGTSPGQFRGIGGIAIDPSGSVYVVDTGNHRIQKFSLRFIILQSPLINEHLTACSLYSPPAFSWNVSEDFRDYNVQFSSDRSFASISFEFAVQSPATQMTIPSATWEQIMMLPGASGGTIYWRVVGTTADQATETSAVRSFSVGAEPVGNPNVSPTEKRSRPVLSWQTNCNIKFKVWFGSDSSFTKKTYSFVIENPNGSEGAFSKTLTALQWLRTKMLAKNKSGSTIYWYVESWDGLGRYSKTDVMNFVLTD